MAQTWPLPAALVPDHTRCVDRAGRPALQPCRVLRGLAKPPPAALERRRKEEEKERRRLEKLQAKNLKRKQKEEAAHQKKMDRAAKKMRGELRSNDSVGDNPLLLVVQAHAMRVTSGEA